MSRYASAYENAKGPGDSRPTAMDIIRDEGLTNALAGKTALVTGANTALGLETARALHAAGITVYLGARTAAKADAAIKSIQASNPSSSAPLHALELSLDSFDSVRAGAADFLARSAQLNILVCNAGVMATPEGRTASGFETQFGICHLGHFLLFSLLKDVLLASSTPAFHSRVVAVSSVGHRAGGVLLGDYNFEKTPYEPWRAYGQAKTANIHMANEIERRYGARGLHGLSLHPGGIRTGLQEYVDDAVKGDWDKDMRIWRSQEQGAATSVFCAVSAEWEGRGGRFLADCVEKGPMVPGNPMVVYGDEGYAPWAYDEEGARKLWADSCKFVGVENDE